MKSMIETEMFCGACGIRVTDTTNVFYVEQTGKCALDYRLERGKQEAKERKIRETKVHELRGHTSKRAKSTGCV